MKHLLLLVAVLSIATGCQTMATRSKKVSPVSDLDRRYQAIVQNIEPYGEGGKIVLDIAYRVLREGKAEGKWSLVGLEDLWAESIQEGRGLMNDPDRRWGKTTAEETKDMIGQTTIGPWQITITNVKNIYGLPYGISPDWPDSKVYVYCRDHPEVQAKMIADYIQEAYTKYGKRSPYGIQRYFWIEAYVKGWIGQGIWDKSVLPEAPGGDWTKLTPEMKADTGFYAKQVLVGWKHSPGLLYWLCVTGDQAGIREALRTWRDQKIMVWDDNLGEGGDATLTSKPGQFAVQPGDFKYLEAYPECQGLLQNLAREVLDE